MTLEEIDAALERALALRTPRFPPEEAPRFKIAALEEYLVESAYVNGDLYAAAHWCHALVDHYKAEVEQMAGWEVALAGASASRATVAQINAAKRRLHPEIFEAGGDARRLSESIQAQIKRLEFEAQWVISRLYTFISGG